MGLFKRNKKEPVPRILEGLDIEWIENLPGEEYEGQDPKLEVGMAARIGTREHQQDSLAARWLNDSLLVAMLCDGMGGLEGGEKASQTAISHIMSRIEEESAELTSDKLFEIIRETNEKIKCLEDDDGEPMNCGTTMTLLIVRGGIAVWMSIGDSRIYYLSEEGLRCITKDHNYAFWMERQYPASDDTVDASVRMDMLVSYLGAPEVKFIDYNTVPWNLRHEDVMLLSSDGMVKLLDEKRIEEILSDRDKPADEIAHDLVKEASEKADTRQDNTTVIAIRYREPERKENRSRRRKKSK